MDKKLKLVIADDEPYIRTNMKTLFPWDEMGYEIAATFSNGSDTLNYLETYGADVLLTDIRMPVMDGIQLLQKIREHKLPVYVIILSAYSDFEYARQGILYGAIEYILKPVGYEELTSVFSALWNKLNSPTDFPVPDTLTQLSDYISQHLDTISLDSAAKSVDLSSDYVSRLFRKQMGISFSEYVHKIRMESASSLTRNVNLQINEIASQLGYHNAKNFSRAFRNYYGLTPMEYRKKEI